ncbi:MAG: tubulin-like doman-containing protein, partial [Chloroflexi bacterium]|nr:tubulin-like doman-containing protein [Chloroflexota bacterium]
MTTEIRFEPTLFIFLGTSAGQVGWRLKSLLHKAYGDVPVLRFLWVDADSSRDDQAAHWLGRDEERVDLVGFNGDAVLANLSAYPTIRAWWPRESRLKPGFIQRGAKQIRLYGRLALFRMFSDRSAGPAFIDKLRAAVESIQNIENLDATEKMGADKLRYIVENRSARVFIIFSTCGGTGSSMTFDVAYLCRNLFRNTDVSIIGVSMLPPVIDKAIKNETQIQWEKIRANTYAWFKENDYLLTTPFWNVTYPEGAPVTLQAPPFNLNFVVDLGNQAGNRLNSEDDIFTLIAQAIFLDTGSSIGGAMRGFNANVSVILDEFRGRQRAYSSLAAASLIYPAQKILNYCGARLGRSLIQEGFLALPASDEVVEEASALAGRLRLRDTQLLVDLLSERQVIQLNSPIIRKSKAADKIRSLLVKQETLDADERERQGGIIAIKAADLLRAVLKQFNREIAILTVKRGGLFAQAVLDALTADTNTRALIAQTTSTINGFKNRLIQQGVQDEDLSHTKDSYRSARDRLRAMEADPKQAVLRLVAKKVWQRHLDGARDDGLRWLADVNQITLQLSAQREAANIYDQMIHLARNLEGLLAE